MSSKQTFPVNCSRMVSANKPRKSRNLFRRIFQRKLYSENCAFPYSRLFTNILYLPIYEQASDRNVQSWQVWRLASRNIDMGNSFNMCTTLRRVSKLKEIK